MKKIYVLRVGKAGLTRRPEKVRTPSPYAKGFVEIKQKLEELTLKAGGGLSYEFDYLGKSLDILE